MQDLDFSDLWELDDERQHRVREIYEEAFPPAEREPFDQLVSGAEAGDKVTVVAMEGMDPIGFAVASPLSSAGVTLVEYMAVNVRRRGMGYGTALVRNLTKTIERRKGPLRLILEVEDPDEPEISPETRRHRQRRVQFYERLGASIFPPSDYRVPAFDGQGTLPMRLMYFDARTEPGPAPTFPESARIVEAIYREGYGLSQDHPLVQMHAKRHCGG
ncbi:GNAT family N-acetyltransferase [Rhodococcus aetherivorans]